MRFAYEYWPELERCVVGIADNTGMIVDSLAIVKDEAEAQEVVRRMQKELPHLSEMP